MTAPQPPEAEPTVDTEAEPTVDTEAEPTVDTEAEPTVDTEAEPTVRLARYVDPGDPGHPHANFRAEVAAFSALDPLTTIRGLSATTGIPVDAIVRYVLARYATSGSGGLLELGPSMVHRLWQPVAAAEAAADDATRLRAYAQLRDMIGWLRAPLVDESTYRGAGPVRGGTPRSPGRSG